MLNFFENEFFSLIFLSIFLGGIIKGTVGIGMSMFSVPLIALFLPPTKAMMLLCFPVIISNLIQMDVKKGIGNLRFLPMFLSLFVGILIGGKLILNFKLNTISLIISLIIIFSSISNLLGISFKYFNKKNDMIFTIILGFFSGILGGVSTFYAPPIITYLVSIKLNKEFFIRTTASMYFFGSIPLYGSLIYHDLGNFDDLLISSILLIPALFGQFIGSKIRSNLNNQVFYNLSLIILIIIGLVLFFKNINSFGL